MVSVVSSVKVYNIGCLLNTFVDTLTDNIGVTCQLDNISHNI